MNEPTTIQELAELAVQRRGVSGRRLADVAERLGHKVSYGTINRMRAGTYTAHPSDSMVRSLAVLAMVSEEVAFAAAGKPLPGPPLAERLPEGVDNLSEQSKKVIYELAKALIHAEQGTKNHDTTGQHPQPEPQADHEDDADTAGGRQDDDPRDPRPEQKSDLRAPAPDSGHDDEQNNDELHAHRERRHGGDDAAPPAAVPEVDEDGVPLDPELKKAFFLGMAAHQGTSTMDAFNRRQALLGEESQDGGER